MSAAETGYGTQEFTEEERAELERAVNNAREVQLARLERRETKLQAKPRVETEEEATEREYCAAFAAKLLKHELDPEHFWDLKPR
jgi:hypothetical protein